MEPNVANYLSNQALTSALYSSAGGQEASSGFSPSRKTKSLWEKRIPALLDMGAPVMGETAQDFLELRG